MTLPSRQGPEDSPKWAEMAHEIKTPVVLTCRGCKSVIEVWHCADSGCCWCAACGGTNSKKEEKK